MPIVKTKDHHGKCCLVSSLGHAFPGRSDIPDMTLSTTPLSSGFYHIFEDDDMMLKPRHLDMNSVDTR